MKDQSLWRALSIPPISHGTLPRHVDAAVVGAGMTGLTAAYLLKKAGKRVAVFERDRIGAGETGSTTAHLTQVTDVRLKDLVKHFGKDAARLVWKGGATSIDLIESHAEELRIPCGFQRVPGCMCASIREHRDETQDLREEFELASELGFAARFLPKGPLGSGPAVSYADQALFHPLSYLAGLARAIDGDGSLVCEGAEVGGVIDDPLAVIVNGENITCDHLIIATHVPLAGNANVVSALLFQTKLYPYSSYVFGARLPRGAMSPGLYWDTSDPYYYLRVHEDDDGPYAIFGGQDHKTGQSSNPEECYGSLAQVMHELLPDAAPERRWSGQVIETNDGLPYIGHTASRQFIGTGYAGNGMTFGTLAGLMAHDAVLGKANPWRELFDPQRKSVRGGLTTLIAENVDYPWHFVRDRLRQDRSGTPASVARGDGKVLMVDGQRVACHRTQDGSLIMVKAECTHMGCLVRWNGAERTWDCPCHGSRFTPEGLVIGGPAETPLERVESTKS